MYQIDRNFKHFDLVIVNSPSIKLSGFVTNESTLRKS